MDTLYHQLNHLKCLTINDYLKQNQVSNQLNIIITTPELMILLRRLSYKFGIIKTANYLIDNIKNNPSKLNFADLISQGHCLLKQLQDQFSIANITKRKENNTIQFELYKIYEKLNLFEQKLESFYEVACQQIEMTNNQLNVTDRLIGYRNNLNCISSTKYTQEQAGICIKYPGESETRSTFTKPSHCVSEVLTNHGQLRVCKPGYQINPHSEIKLDGYGPIKQYELNKMEQSEYAQTYTWPDGKKIHTSPWNRLREANHLYGVK
ncbi:unnamed protein product [Schistosoma haematobium]|nr:unnamed protein product [Schistosoma haematobium]